MSVLPAFRVAGGWLLCPKLSQNRAWHRWKLTQKKPYLEQFPNRPGHPCWYHPPFWSTYMGQPQVFATGKWVGSGSGSSWQPHTFPASTPLRWLTNGSDNPWCSCNEGTHLWGQRESVTAPIMTDISLRDRYLAPSTSITWSSSAEGHLGCHRAACASLCSSMCNGNIHMEDKSNAAAQGREVLDIHQ